MDKTIVLLCSFALMVVAEPPPSSQYGVPGTAQFGGAEGPSSQYGPPTGAGGPFRRPPSTQYGAPGFRPGGGGYDGDNAPANYEFSYDVDAPEYGVKFGHQESRQGDNAVGSYNVLLPDGRTQLVEYEADLNGYRPKISYQGTANTGGYGRGPQGGGGYQ